jgi:hypothetical protein
MRGLNLGRYALGACVTVAMCACGSGQARDSVAIEYDKPGNPSLTFLQRSLILKTLDEVTPCQRPLVRCAVFGPKADDLILYFAVPHGQGSHVFGTAIDVYFPDRGYDVPIGVGDPHAEQRKKFGIQWDIAHQPCPHSTQTTGTK